MFPYRVTSKHYAQVLGEFESEKDAVMFAWILGNDDREEPIVVYEKGRVILQWNEHEDSQFENDAFEPDCKVMKDGRHVATITNANEALYFYRSGAVLEWINDGGLIETRPAPDPDETGEDVEYFHPGGDGKWEGVIFYDDEQLAEAEDFYRSFCRSAD